MNDGMKPVTPDEDAFLWERANALSQEMVATVRAWFKKNGTECAGETVVRATCMLLAAEMHAGCPLEHVLERLIHVKRNLVAVPGVTQLPPTVPS